MSINQKKILQLICLIIFNWFYSQEKVDKKAHIIYMDFKSVYTSSHSIRKDTTSGSFGIYINGFQSKEKRKVITEKYRNSKEIGNSIGLPAFSVSFYTVSSPKRLTSIDTIKFITEEEYSKNIFLVSSPIFIIHKLKDGTYLKWEVVTMGEE